MTQGTFNAEENWLACLRVERGLSSNTLSAYRSDIRDFFRFTGNNGCEIKDINAGIVQSFINFKNETGIARRSIARAISAIKNFLEYAQFSGLGQYPFLSVMESVKTEAHFPDYLSGNEVDLLLAAAKTKDKTGRDYSMLLSLYTLGLRVSELTELTFRNFNFDDGFVRVRGKGSKERLVPFPEFYIRELGTFLNAGDQTNTLSASHHKGKQNSQQNSQQNERIFKNRRGGGISRVSVWKIMKNYAREAGIIRNVFPHTLRHSFATHMIQNGADIRTVQILLGHSDIKTTEIYTHLSTENLKREVARCHPMYK